VDLTAIIVQKVLYGVLFGYVVAGIVEWWPWATFPQRIRNLCGTFRLEASPLILPLAVVHYFARVWLERADNPWFNTSAITQLIFWALVWYDDRRRGGGDGRWKRRLRKLAARVSVRGSRLAVESGR
jgi:hypothetical protein